MIRTRPCQRCKTETIQELSCAIKADQSKSFGWFCLTCKWWTEQKNGAGFWISKEAIEGFGVSLDSIRVVEIHDQPRCAKCGKRGSQEHHWAPKHLFKDADDWPKDYLCEECHTKWHDVVTPNMKESHGAF